MTEASYRNRSEIYYIIYGSVVAFTTTTSRDINKMRRQVQRNPWHALVLSFQSSESLGSALENEKWKEMMLLPKT
jgi:hypothetical protein